MTRLQINLIARYLLLRMMQPTETRNNILSATIVMILRLSTDAINRLMVNEIKESYLFRCGT
jgi:hypothetical protein